MSQWRVQTKTLAEHYPNHYQTPLVSEFLKPWLYDNSLFSNLHCHLRMFYNILQYSTCKHLSLWHIFQEKPCPPPSRPNIQLCWLCTLFTPMTCLPLAVNPYYCVFFQCCLLLYTFESCCISHYLRLRLNGGGFDVQRVQLLNAAPTNRDGGVGQAHGGSPPRPAWAAACGVILRPLLAG